MEKSKKDCCGMHKMILGIGIMIFGLVLYFSSSPVSLETNLNWSAAFFVLGFLAFLKGLYCYFKKY